jgi:hypothetical protein
MSDQSTFGRLQTYLVLGAIASADFAQAAPFKSTVGARRAKLYDPKLRIRDNEADFATFTTEMKATLLKGGFDPVFVDAINWNNFLRAGVWEALKTLNDQFLVLSEYTGTDCPCIDGLVAYARSQEIAVEARRLAARQDRDKS